MTVVVIPSHQQARTIRKIGIPEIGKDIYGAPVHRADIVRHWKMKRGTACQELPERWRITKSEGNPQTRLFYVVDHEGNRRGQIRTGVLDPRNVLRGLPMVYHRFIIGKSESGREMYYIQDRRRSHALFDKMQHPTEAVLIHWLETHLPEYKDPFAYWNLTKEDFHA